MMIIKTSLKEFKGKGIGLVSEEFIKKGQIVWKYNSRIDLIFNKKDVPNKLKEFFHIYACDLGGNKLYLNIDNTRFINHSKNPNIKNMGFKKKNIAVKDIKIGEEITIDYEELENKPINFKDA